MDKLLTELNEITKRIVTQTNVDTDNWNDLVVDADNMQNEIKALKERLAACDETLSKQHQALIMLKSDKDKLAGANTKLSESYISADIKIKVLKSQLDTSKKEEKSWRELTKKNQKANAEKQKIIKRMQKNKSGKEIVADGVRVDPKTGYIKNLDMVGMWYLYKEENESLLINPVVQKITGSHGVSNQIAILYTTGNGVYRNGVIIEDGETVGWANPNQYNDTPERTRKLCDKFIQDPSEKVNDIAKRWLYKVNIMQKANIKLEDITEIKS